MILKIAYDQPRGPELCLGVLRVRSKKASIWSAIESTYRDENIVVRRLQSLFIDGEASVLDVDPRGWSALTVRIRPSSANSS